ncbi:MAG: DUF4070 domain-containing protein [Verrucomicrobiae bacterium]|nr:DUF4070 domain-containing protein [Verrucomicrobiae bacterium]
MNVLLVYPPNPETFWSFQHVLHLVAKRSSYPPLGLLTVAALLPRKWVLRLVDANVRALRDEDILWADYVLISGMIVHRAAVREIAVRCRDLGRPAIGGGPLFAPGSGTIPEIPHVVVGEAEEVMASVVADMEQGAVRPEYRAGGRPDLSRVPIPRWDLIDFRDYVTMAVQFSRGCPFDCEFCDIVAMSGRVPRTKSAGQFVAELEALRVRGWKDMVFVVDDNFIGNRRRTRELLGAMIAWRERTGTAMGFLTEASVNLADDPELCASMVGAGFRKVFVGIETPSVEGLQECQKVQNQRRDLVAAVQSLQRAGLEVMGGFIVGFDSDPVDIFRRQFEFIQRSGVVTAMVGLLTALPQTRLYQRLLREGRIETESSGNNTGLALNFTPRLNREFLQSGYRELMRRLYEPREYYRRIRTFLKHHRPSAAPMRLSVREVTAFLKSLWLLGLRHRGRRSYWRLMGTALLRHPRQFRMAMEMAILGHHFRCVSAGLQGPAGSEDAPLASL